MEFEQSTDDKSAEVSDAERMSASSKKLELSPLHTDIAPEALPSGTASDTFGSPIATATIASESEDTSAYQNKITSIAGLPTRPHSKVTLIVAVALFVVVTGTIGYLLLAK